MRNWHILLWMSVGLSIMGSSGLVLAGHSNPWIWGIANVTGFFTGYCIARCDAGAVTNGESK